MSTIQNREAEFKIRRAVTEILDAIGDDSTRSGIVDTPERVAKAYLNTIFSGYKEDPAKLLSVQFDPNDVCGCEIKTSNLGIVMLTDIEFYSTCEHHMLPFFGRAHVAYIPAERVVGVSKLARLVDVYARRLQIQERMAEQIANSIDETLRPLGVAVMLEAQHMCMTSRGVAKQNSIMKYTALRGKFLEDTNAGNAARHEFYRLIEH